VGLVRARESYRGARRPHLEGHLQGFRFDRFVLKRDDQSRRWINFDKQRLDNDIATAAVKLDKIALELDTMLPQPINKDYFAEDPYTLKREKRNPEEYKDALRALVDEGLVTQSRLISTVDTISS